MADTTPDLWPSDFGKPEVRFPAVVLREQASLLGQKTGHLVEAEVRSDSPVQSKRGFVYRFYLVAPALEGYRYYLFSIEHDPGEVYPVRFYPKESEGEHEELHSEADLLKRLSAVFNAPETKRVVQNLMAQSQAA